VGAVAALAVAASARLRESIRPGALGLAVVAAGIVVFLPWTIAAYSGFSMAQGVKPGWLFAMAGLWLITAAATYAVGYLLAGTRLARITSFGSRLLLPPVALLCVAAGIVQWTERPRLLGDEADWTRRTASAAAPSGKPNVVLLVIDTQRVDRFGSYGYDRPTTPRIDAFAADALLFENATSAANWTLASHASMFTGLHPTEHGADNHHLWLDDDFTTLAELLRERGYETVSFSNNTWVSKISNLTQGFDFEARPGNLHHARGTLLSKFLDGVLYPAGWVTPWLGSLTSEDQGAKFTAPLVERWLERRDAARPFFLFVNIADPHGPFRPAPPYRDLFVAPEDIALSYRSNWDEAKPFTLLRRDVYTEDELRVMNDAYDAETRLVDDHVGEVLAVLASHVPLDETLIILTADHGENLGDHHMQGHGHCVYDTLVRVPMIVRFPPRVAPGRASRLVQTTDILPTVMDALGEPAIPEGLRGRSLLQGDDGAPASTDGRGLSGRVVVAERITPGAETLQTSDVRFNALPWMGLMRSIRQGPWKFIVTEGGAQELYHVVDDPGETTNLLDREPEVARALALELARWIDGSRPYAGSGTLEGEQQMDDATKAQLRALGYLH
jgi:arylsulfatase A-like enzyme